METDVFADAEETVIDREGGSTRKPGKATSAVSERQINQEAAGSTTIRPRTGTGAVTRRRVASPE
jgi:hypothetical protein